MKQLRKLLTMGVLLLMLVSLSACQKEEGEIGKKEKNVATDQSDVGDAIATENAEEPAETEATDVVNEAAGTFDFEQIRQNVVIDGKKVSVPFKLDDLGEEYIFDENLILDGILEHHCGVDIIMPNGETLSAWVLEEKKENVTRDSEIMSVAVMSSSAAENLSIDGLKMGMTAESVKERFGEPDKINSGTTIEHWYYEDEKGQVFFTMEDGKASSMGVIVY